MSKYYRSQKTRNLHRHSSFKPYRLIYSKIDLYLSFPCILYLDRRLGVGQSPGYPFSLSSAFETVTIPEPNPECDYCTYVAAVKNVESTHDTGVATEDTIAIQQ